MFAPSFAGGQQLHNVAFVLRSNQSEGPETLQNTVCFTSPRSAFMKARGHGVGLPSWTKIQLLEQQRDGISADE